MTTRGKAEGRMLKAEGVRIGGEVEHFGLIWCDLP
jgi:hypothetical protein